MTIRQRASAAHLAAGRRRAAPVVSLWRMVGQTSLTDRKLRSERARRISFSSGSMRTPLGFHGHRIRGGEFGTDASELYADCGGGDSHDVRDLAGVATFGEVKVSDCPLAPRQCGEPPVDRIGRRGALSFGERREESGESSSAGRSAETGETEALSDSIDEGSGRGSGPQPPAAPIKEDQRFLRDVFGLQAASEQAPCEGGELPEVGLDERPEGVGIGERPHFAFNRSPGVESVHRDSQNCRGEPAGGDQAVILRSVAERATKPPTEGKPPAVGNADRRSAVTIPCFLREWRSSPGSFGAALGIPSRPLTRREGSSRTPPGDSLAPAPLPSRRRRPWRAWPATPPG